jgi:hypothetical protein
MAQKGSGPNFRSSVTGKYVKPGYAKQHPNTTEKERRKP